MAQIDEKIKQSIDKMGRTIKYKVEVLTPVHIGSGYMLPRNTELLVSNDQKQIGVIDIVKTSKLVGDKMKDWIDNINRGLSVLQFLKSFEGFNIKDYSKRIISNPTIQLDDKYDKQIKEQLFLANGSPVIPGSSFKGSFRTAIFNQLIEKKHIDLKKIHYKDKRGNVKFSDKYLIEKIFGSDPKSDTFRFINATDATFNVKTQLTKTKIINLNDYGWTIDNRKSQLVEVIPPGSKSEISITIADKLYEYNSEKEYIITETGFLQSYDALFQNIREHTIFMISDEIEFINNKILPEMERRAEKHIYKFSGHLEELLEKAENLDSNSVILRLGFGSGWTFMTSGWIKDKDLIEREEDYNKIIKSIRDRKNRHYSNNIPFPKTRNLLIGGVPLGFVKLSYV